MKVKELKRDSQEEINFKAILASFIDMIKLAGHIELFEYLFPIIREKLSEPYHSRIDAFIKFFIKENFVTSDKES